MKKILFVTLDDYPHIGGKSTHMASLIEGLNKNDVECEVVARNVINKNKLFFKKLCNVIYKFINPSKYLYLRKKIEFDLFFDHIKKNINLDEYDAISCQDALSATIVGRLKKDSNIALTMHTYFGLEYSLDNDIFNENNAYYQKLLSLELESLNYAKKIICVDARIKEHVTEIIGEKYKLDDFFVTSIKNFTNVDVLTTEKLKHDKFIIMCVRRLVEKNGVYYGVEAMKYLKDKDNILLKVVGDGPEKEKIEKCILDNNLSSCVEMVGAVSNEQMPNLYKRCDLVLVPSITVNGLQEATSISAIEAMSCAIPLIASNIGGLSELIQNNENGFLVDEKDSKAIAKNIEKLYSDKELYEKIAKNARKSVEENYSHIKAAQNYLEVFFK